MKRYILEPISRVKAPFWPFDIADDTPRDRGPSDEVKELLPMERGYWLDTDLMHVSGIGSVAVLKKLIALGAAKADYIGRPEGGRIRAWSARNVFRVYMVKAFADAGRMSLLAAGHLLRAVHAPRIEELLGMNALLRDIQLDFARAPSTRDWFYVPKGQEDPGPTLLIMDWDYVRLIQSKHPVRDDVVARIRLLDGPEPRIDFGPPTAPPGQGRCDLVIRLELVVRDFCDALSRSGTGT